MAAKVAIIQGIKISVGLGALTAALAAIIVTGINVNPEACKHKNMIWALDASDFEVFNSCKLSIALIPKGVAALSRFNRLAEKFITIWPTAGCPFGTSGKSLEKKGPMIRDNKRIPPACSAILKNPRNNAIIPINPKLMETALLQVSIIPSLF